MEDNKNSEQESPIPSNKWERGAGRVITMIAIIGMIGALYFCNTKEQEIQAITKQLEDKDEVIESMVVKEKTLTSTIDESEATISNLKEELSKANQTISEKEKEIGSIKEKHRREQVTRGGSGRSLGEYVVTCYDLSVQSCGKPIGSKGYGVTASGVNLAGKSWDTARAIAVDPTKIPLGSKVRLTFTNPNYSKYNGVYTAVDTGGAIKGNKIDFFMGDFRQNKTHSSVWEFGKTKAKLEILK